jgi:hypothetical protein
VPLAAALDLTDPRPEQLVGWTPVRLHWVGTEPVVDWCYTEGADFKDPFFDQTVDRCLRRPFCLLFRHHTAMATMSEVAAVADTLPLAGLVFHGSRCGSTLVSQMLAHLPTTLVMAEPAPVHSVLAARSNDPAVADEQVVEWLQWIMAVLGRRRRPEQRHLVLKLDAWAVLYLPLILKAFPETPWIFVYRDPIEVLVSHLGHRGYHMIPGCLPPELLGLGPGDPTALAPEQYMARVLAALLDAASRSPDEGRSMLINYRQLPGVVTTRIAQWFGLAIDSGAAADLTGVADRDAKNPALAFAADSGDKQARASQRLRTASNEWVQPAYRSLESQRTAQETAPRTAQETAPRTAPRTAQETAPRTAQETAPRTAQEPAPRTAQETAPRTAQATAPRTAGETGQRTGRR